MRVVLDDTGKGQMEVLAVLAESSAHNQSELVERTSLSKGAVSNNLSKLEDKNIVERREEISISETGLLAQYREHLEGFMTQDMELSVETQKLRREAKKRALELVEEPKLIRILTTVLASSRSRDDLESLNSVFKETDRIVREIPEKTVELKLVAAITDYSREILDESEFDETVKEILQEVENE